MLNHRELRNNAMGGFGLIFYLRNRQRKYTIKNDKSVSDPSLLFWVFRNALYVLCMHVRVQMMEFK